MGKIPGINHQQAIRALQRAGFWILRQSGHVVMTNGVRIVTSRTSRNSSSTRWPSWTGTHEMIASGIAPLSV